MILDFERPIIELEQKIEELEKLSSEGHIDLSEEIEKLKLRLQELEKAIFENLSPWQRVQIARHPDRPYTLDYIKMIAEDFAEFHGDRLFGDDKAIVCGFGMIEGERFLIIGHQKGRNTKENIMRTFGSAHPEGYRKAMRLMKMAEKFGIPIAVFIDTPGAYPGIGAEERGQAYAISYNIREMAMLSVPIIVFVIGEGGSGGALGIGFGDRVYVLENAYYSVISPEGCAAILWKDGAKAPEAAKALKLTAKDLFGMGIIDGIVEEPLGGAHRDYQKIGTIIKNAILNSLKELRLLPKEELVKARYQRFRKIGVVEE